ncbi:MAG: DNA-directed RNA polymerase subunit D [Candidatus Nitrosotenuis sp.]|uniref:DNA-directed RNA polymerase subunit Rpo3 n=1 Tax=Candidatus Nitrosotenuis uzonensis TaxID=1407055 RepID=A0A812EVS7_9ARCH|nr:DNA-directed RNA polymerase subunit D [Candidatus Nitrosotenuis uzonensis]CAE6484554.1 RNA polymerase insert [Candidatus Nitrosotenuis uzonensis]
MPSLEVLSKDTQRISVKLKGVPLQYANALRRICLNGVPVFAIDTVDIIENSSVMSDEGIAHRLGLIPIKTDLKRFAEPSKCACQSKTGCSNCRVMLVIDSGNTDSTRIVTSAEMSSEDETIKPVSDKIPIVQIAPGQKVKLEAYARLGRGTDHAKWNSANISVLTHTDKPEEYILTVETTGALAPEQIVVSAIDELEQRLEEFKGMIAELKA